MKYIFYRTLWSFVKRGIISIGSAAVLILVLGFNWYVAIATLAILAITFLWPSKKKKGS